MRDHNTYEQFRNSYANYPARFPNHTQNHPYFRGKYLGIVDGWMAYYTPPEPPSDGLDIPGDVDWNEKIKDEI